MIGKNNIMPHSKISMLIALANNPDANPADLLIAANDPQTTTEILLAVAKHPNASIEVFEIIAKSRKASAEALTHIAARIKLDDDTANSLREMFASPIKLFLKSMLRSILWQPEFFLTHSLLLAIDRVKAIASIFLAIIDHPNAHATTLITLINNGFISEEDRSEIFKLIFDNPTINPTTLIAIVFDPSTTKYIIQRDDAVINLLKRILNKQDATNEELIKQLTEFVMALIDKRYLNKQNLLSILTTCPEEKKYMLLIAIINAAANKFKNPADLAIILIMFFKLKQ